MFYTYSHTRPDTKEVFYIGKGCKRRAYHKSDRNYHWHNVVNKNNGVFIVTILNWFNDEESALQSEQWQIGNLRHNGTLVNITEGGDQPPIVQMFGSKNPMTRPEVAQKAKITAESIRKSIIYRERLSKARKGKALGDANGMRKPAQKGIFSGLNNAMSNYVHREKFYSQNKTKGIRNGMYGRFGDKNPAYGKPSAMRGKKNIWLSWVAANKTWQNYWGA